LSDPSIQMMLMPMETINVNRPNQTFLEFDGYEVQHTFTQFDAIVNIQPVFGVGRKTGLGKQVIKENPGDRLTNAVVVYSNVELLLKDQFVRPVDGSRYEVQQNENWSPYPGMTPYPFPPMNCLNFRSIAQLIEAGA